MRLNRSSLALGVAALLAAAAPTLATPLAPFIDLQEPGLSLAEDGAGLVNWDHSTPVALDVNVGGNVRFALLYWAGRDRPCTFDGTTCAFPQPFKDQQVTFNGTPITGTVIGTESQPTSANGPIGNIGYYADVTSIVAAAGSGAQSFTFGDGNPGSNLWRLDGVGLMVAYTDPTDPTYYRVLVWDGLDFAYGDDPTPGETRVTHPVTFGHGATDSGRNATLYTFAGDGTANRPDNTTISNNATQYNTLDGSDDPQWDTDEYAITIPANIDTTTVQMNSAPRGQNPDSLLWEVAALRVALPGDVEEQPPAPPTCPTTVISGPPAQAVTTFQDTGSGIVSIVVTKSENADTVVPPFVVGTTDPIVVTSTKIDQTKRAVISSTVTDGAGNVRVCDPIHVIAVRNAGRPETLVNTDVPRAENKVLIRNGSPGIANLTITVNGTKYKVTGLRNSAPTTVDISQAMTFENNTVNLEARGPQGSWAEIVIWDGGEN